MVKIKCEAFIFFSSLYISFVLSLFKFSNSLILLLHFSGILFNAVIKEL